MTNIPENAVNRRLAPVLRKSISFLTTVAFNLLLGSYVFITIGLTLGKPHSWGPDPDFSALMLIGALMGIYLGGVAWISNHLFKFTLSLSRRLTIMIASGTLVSAGLLTILHYPRDWKTLGYYAVPGVVLGIVTELISASSRNPWELIVRGLGAKRKEARALALAGGVALRLAGVIGVLYSLFMFAALQKLWGLIQTRADVLFVSIILLHWSLTILVAFVSPPRWVVLVTALLINVPTLMLIVEVWDIPGGPVLPLLYLLLWGLFVVGRPGSVRRRSVKAGGIHQVEPAWIKGR